MARRDDVAAWKKRLNRKGPFHLLRTEAGTHDKWDHSAAPPFKKTVPISIYVVIWNDGEKTKLGAFSDHMSCRYGVGTRSVLKGDTPYDLWNGHNVDDDSFAAMLAVRNGTSSLPLFNLDTIEGLSW